MADYFEMSGIETETGGAFLSVAWPTGVQLLVFFCSSVPVVLFDTPGISRLNWIERSGVASSAMEQMSMKQRESPNQSEITKKRKAGAKGSSSESSFSELACSICCRQFRAKLA